MHLAASPTEHRKGVAASLAAALRDRRAITGVVSAVTAAAMFGFVALATEGGTWLLTRRNASSAADAAAVAAALVMSQGQGTDRAAAAAVQIAARNGFAQRDGTTIEVNVPPLAGPRAGDADAAEVIIRRPQPAWFARMFLDGDVTVRARSVATVQRTAEACVLAMDGQLLLTGSSVTAGESCVLASNYATSSAIEVGGSASVRAFSLTSVGGCYGCDSPAVELARAYGTYQPPVANAFAWLDGKPLPTFQASTCLTPPNSGVMLPFEENGGKAYCKTLQLSGNASLTLRPGTYYFWEASFSIQSGDVRCPDCTGGRGVTIVFTGGNVERIGGPKINANANVRLNAPRIPESDPDYRGVLFLRDARATGNDVGNPEVVINGGAGTTLEGGMYFPNSFVRFNGSSEVDPSSCTVLVAGAIDMSGPNTTHVNIFGCREFGTPVPGARALTFAE